MTTARQTLSNRRNALKSTGPKTDAGKTRSRANGLKHGLAASVVVSPADDQAAVEARLESWRGGFVVRNDEDAWVYTQMVVASVKVDRCQREEQALAASFQSRANLCWDEDRSAAVEGLAAGLSRQPALTSRRLETSRHGCEWLISRWRPLAAVLESGGSWTDTQRNLALDLLGIDPEFRSADDGLGADPGSPEALELVVSEIERLEARKADALDDLDESNRHAAGQGIFVETPRPLALVRRYEAAFMRRYQSARKHLLENGRPRRDGVTPAPAPTAERPSSLPAVESPPTPPPPSTPEPAAPAVAPKNADVPPADRESFARRPLLVDFDPRPTFRDATRRSEAPMNRRQRRALEKMAAKSR